MNALEFGIGKLVPVIDRVSSSSVGSSVRLHSSLNIAQVLCHDDKSPSRTRKSKNISVVVSSLLLQWYTRPVINDNGEMSRNHTQNFRKGSTDLFIETGQLAHQPAPHSGSLRQLMSAASNLVRKSGSAYHRLEEQRTDDEEELHLL